MDFTNLSFSSGQVLTASVMNAMQNNFESIADQTSGTGAPVMIGVPKAWVNHDATGTLVGSQYNISSVTRTALGKFKTSFTIVFSGNYGATWGFRGGGGQGDNRMRNITLYNLQSDYVEYKGRNSTTQQSGDEDLPMSLVFWQV